MTTQFGEPSAVYRRLQRKSVRRGIKLSTKIAFRSPPLYAIFERFKLTNVDVWFKYGVGMTPGYQINTLPQRLMKLKYLFRRQAVKKRCP